jgi:hypothetical protein
MILISCILHLLALIILADLRLAERVPENLKEQSHLKKQVILPSTVRCYSFYIVSQLKRDDKVNPPVRTKLLTLAGKMNIISKVLYIFSLCPLNNIYGVLVNLRLFGTLLTSSIMLFSFYTSEPGAI